MAKYINGWTSDYTKFHVNSGTGLPRGLLDEKPQLGALMDDRGAIPRRQLLQLVQDRLKPINGTFQPLPENIVFGDQDLKYLVKAEIGCEIRQAQTIKKHPIIKAALLGDIEGQPVALIEDIKKACLEYKKLVSPSQRGKLGGRGNTRSGRAGEKPR